MINQNCRGCCEEVTAGTMCLQCYPSAVTPSTMIVNISDCNGSNLEFMNKSKTVREGDYIWYGGKKLLWRKLTDEQRKIAINDMKEEQKNEKSFVSKKKKSW